MREDSAFEGFSQARGTDSAQSEIGLRKNRFKFSAGMRNVKLWLAVFLLGGRIFGELVCHFDFDVAERFGAVFFIDGFKDLMFLHRDLLGCRGIEHTYGKGLVVVRFGKYLSHGFGRKHGFGKAAELLADFYGFKLLGEIIFSSGFGKEFLECVEHD